MSSDANPSCTVSGVTDAAPTATRDETIASILAESQRPQRVPIRDAFCQLGRGASTRPGPLAAFVRRGRHAALDQFLLLLAWASAHPYDVRRDSRIWARATGLAADASGRAAVSRNWQFMAETKLIASARAGRLTRVTLLREDGSGRLYQHPSATRSTYFRLPFEYWTQGYYSKLDLPAKALLLIAMSLPDGFSLPPDRGPGWYGISPSTVERGLRDLRRADLLTVRRVRKTAPLAPEGYTFVNLYTLAPPFGPKKAVVPEGPA